MFHAVLEEEDSGCSIAPTAVFETDGLDRYNEEWQS